MDFRILGPLEVVDRGKPIPLGGRRQRTVLAALLVNANETVSTDRLVDDVWGDDPPETARRSLQAYISRLRNLLGDEAISPVPPGYVLRVGTGEGDWDSFAGTAQAGREAMGVDPLRASALLRESLAMWRGSPFADLADEPCLAPAIARLEDQRLAAVEDRIEADLESGRHGSLVGELESLIARHPLRERFRGQLMLALYRSGRQAEALRAYGATRSYLVSELGVEPSPELQRLEQRILEQDQDLALEGAVQTIEPQPKANPYKGLRAFGEADTADFYGREHLVEELVRRVAGERFLAVIGPSGCGKSSAVRAGLVAALRVGRLAGSDDWCIATMVPGAHPFEELEAALVHGSGGRVDSLREQFRGDDLDLLRAVLRVSDNQEVLLVIDQFEELFLLVDSEEERRRFLRNLAEALEDPHTRIRVVVTLRADFYDLPLRYPEPAAWVADHQVTVPPLSPAELERAAVRPAAAAGVAFEIDLAAELVADVSRHPGALPLFQYTLTELFDRRTGPTLTLDTYRAFGGLNGALRNRAEQLFESLDAGEKEAARQVFLRLVTLGEGTEDTRRRVSVESLADLDRGTEQGVAAVLDRFGEHRLLSFDRDPSTGEPTVELAHEALLSEWPRLAGWIVGSRDGLRLQTALTAESREWLSAGRHPDYLVTGTRLSIFEQWHDETDLQLTAAEQEFLDASLEQRVDQVAAEAARREREVDLERRSVSRLRRLVAVLAVAVLVATGLTAYAANRARLAEDREAEANLYAARVTASELTAASVANLRVDPQRSLLLALHSVNIMRILNEPVLVDTATALHWAIQASKIPYPAGAAGGMAVPGPDGMNGLFEVPLDDLVDLALSGVSRELTSEECSRYLPTDECGPLPDHMEGLAMMSALPRPDDESRPLAGSQVLVMGAFVGLEADGFRAEMARFEELTGVRVTYLGLDDLENRLSDFENAGVGPDMPDIVFIPQPGYVEAGVRAGELMDLSLYLDPQDLTADYSPYLIGLMTFGNQGSGTSSTGAVYGIPLRLNVKSIIWYPVPEFDRAGYAKPATWSELLAVSDRMVVDERTPWCWGEEASEADGWPATDWIEDLVLHEFGVDVYDRWVDGALPFQSPEIRTAFEHLGEIVFHDGYLAGGVPRAVNTPFWLAPELMFDDPPGCWMYRQASFTEVFLPAGVVAGRDALTFPFPAVGGGSSDPVVGGSDFVAAGADRPEVRELIRFINRPDFGVEWVKTWPGFLSANRNFDPAVYDGLAAGYAAQISKALASDSFRFDGSDMMEGNGSWMWAGMIDYLMGGPDSLDEVLANLDDPDWRSANRQGG